MDSMQQGRKKFFNNHREKQKLYTCGHNDLCWASSSSPGMEPGLVLTSEQMPQVPKQAVFLTPSFVSLQVKHFWGRPACEQILISMRRLTWRRAVSVPLGGDLALSVVLLCPGKSQDNLNYLDPPQKRRKLCQVEECPITQPTTYYQLIPNKLSSQGHVNGIGNATCSL